jgi:hypothetical protein
MSYKKLNSNSDRQKLTSKLLAYYPETAKG